MLNVAHCGTSDDMAVYTVLVGLHSQGHIFHSMNFVALLFC